MQVKRFSWLKRPSAWEQAQAWRNHRSTMVRRFRDDASVASAGFANAQIRLSTGMATLAAQASITRTQAEIDALRSRFGSAQNSVNTVA
jgi:hypothetical protein